MPSKSISDKMNPDLVKERQKCSFDVEEFARWWNGGDKKLQEKRDRGKLHKKSLVSKKRKNGLRNQRK